MKKNDIEREFNKLIDSIIKNTIEFGKETRCNCSAQMDDESIENPMKKTEDTAFHEACLKFYDSGKLADYTSLRNLNLIDEFDYLIKINKLDLKDYPIEELNIDILLNMYELLYKNELNEFFNKKQYKKFLINTLNDKISVSNELCENYCNFNDKLKLKSLLNTYSLFLELILEEKEKILNSLLRTKDITEEIDYIKDYLYGNNSHKQICINDLFFYYNSFYEESLSDLCSIEDYKEFLVNSIEIKIKNECENYKLGKSSEKLLLIGLFHFFIYEIKSSASGSFGENYLEEPEEDSECVYCFKFKC